MRVEFRYNFESSLDCLRASGSPEEKIDGSKLRLVWFHPGTGKRPMSYERSRQSSLQKIIYSKMATLERMALEKAWLIAPSINGCVGWP